MKTLKLFLFTLIVWRRWWFSHGDAIGWFNEENNIWYEEPMKFRPRYAWRMAKSVTGWDCHWQMLKYALKIEKPPILVLILIPLLVSCQFATHEAHASATKWEKDTNITWGGTTHTTGADGWDNATDHNASFQVFTQATGSALTGYFGYLAAKAVQLTQQLQNANLSKQALATTQADLQTTLAQLQANAVTGQQKNFAALIASGAINSTNVGTLRH